MKPSVSKLKPSRKMTQDEVISLSAEDFTKDQALVGKIKVVVDLQRPVSSSILTTSSKIKPSVSKWNTSCKMKLSVPKLKTSWKMT